MAKNPFTHAAWTDPNSWGRDDELKIGLNRDLDLKEFGDLHDEIWGFEKGGYDIDDALTGAMHRPSHSLLLMLHATPQQTPGLRKKLDTLEYQFNMQGELSVRRIQFNALLPIVENPKMTLNTLFFKTFVFMPAMSEQYYLTRGNEGRMLNFYIGKHRGTTLQAVSESFGQRAIPALMEAAKIHRAQTNDAGSYWGNTVQPGDTYIADGKPQTYELIVPPNKDPDAQLALMRLIPALPLIQRHAQDLRAQGWDPQTDPEKFGTGLKIRDLMWSMLPGNAPALTN